LRLTSRLREVEFSHESNELDEKLIWENPARIFSLIDVHFPKRNEMERELARRDKKFSKEFRRVKITFQGG